MTTDEIILRCPHCGRRKLYANRVKRLFICFRCGSQGHVSKLGEQAPGVRLADILHSMLPQISGSELQPPPEFDELRPFALEHLQGRGIGRHLIRSLPIYSTRHGILFVFPDQGYWQERRWGPHTPPRWQGPADPPQRPATGVTYHVGVSRPQDRPVVLVEGVGDALKVATAGWPSAALLGKRLHDAQAAQLSELYEGATVMLDSDSAVIERMGAATVAMEHFAGPVRVAPVPDGFKDPGETPVERLRGVLG